MARTSSIFSVTISAAPTTALGIAAGNLTANTSADFAGGNPAWAFADSVTWQTATVYYDPARKQVHAVGKVASTNPWEHYIYSESTNSWGSNTLSTSSSGHMWNTTFAPEHGEYYYVQGVASNIQRYIPGSGWTNTSNGPYTVGSDPPCGLGWHPNLFGTSDGGIVVVFGFGTYAWRRASNTWFTLQTGQQYCGYNGGGGAYDSVNNKVWVGTGNGASGGPRAAIVTAGAGPTSPGSASTPFDPPLSIYGGGAGDTCHKVLPHPYTPGKILLLASNASTVYASTDSGASWSNAGYAHPFGTGQWTCGPIPAYGVVWGLSSPGRGNMSKLWKPGA